ncbi:hypothetical protein [Nocardia jinanensis]|uniref:ABC transporter permease n=1 Tax=Nocardia jinanensis TaxID=382504 RepID=A0A917R533_9NOCA|nr:hypothetical protein [Nocardia jinanensis]GGK90763.1 hypothetical protein GCM10011588_01270 [Nocardia jinanensis]
MSGYLWRRIGQALLVVALSYSAVFFILNVLPGDPIEQQISNPENPITDEDAEAFQLGWMSAVRDQGLRSVVFAALPLALPVAAPIAQILAQGLTHAANSVPWFYNAWIDDGSGKRD